MCRRRFEDLQHRGGVLLAPSGYYQSLRLIPPIFGGTMNVLEEFTGESIAGWLADTVDIDGRTIYVPLVNNLDGQVLAPDRAADIATTVIGHNRAHPDNPVYVIGDDVYVGAYLTHDVIPQPIGAMPGMAPWSISIVTPSKTFTLPTSRIAFATSANERLCRALVHYRTVFSHGRPPQVDELTAAAALCLTPQIWVNSWNDWNRHQLTLVAGHLNALNAELGHETFRVSLPQGGWYLPVQISAGLFGQHVRTSVDAGAVLLHYGQADPHAGLAMLPGELFGRGPQDGWHTLRANLAVNTDTITQAVGRLRDLAITLQHDRAGTVEYALRRARHAVPALDQTLAHRRY